MRRYWLAAAVMVMVMVTVTGCGKKKEDAGAAGSAAAAPAPAVVQATPADLPPSSAPATAEVLAKFDAACDGGHGKACYDAGMRRAKGMGTDTDRVAAASWLEKGCKLDDADSCSMLAGFYAVGQEGITQDKARAVELHQKACPRVPTSCRLLAQYYGRGEIVQQDLEKAMSLLDQACSAGDKRACAQSAEHRAAGTDR